MTLTKDLKSLKEIYYKLGTAYPVNRACEKAESDFKSSLERLSRDYDYANQTLSCHLPASSQITGGLVR